MITAYRKPGRGLFHKLVKRGWFRQASCFWNTMAFFLSAQQRRDGKACRATKIFGQQLLAMADATIMKQKNDSQRDRREKAKHPAWEGPSVIYGRLRQLEQRSK
jgi:hypothetical protein